VEDQAVDAGREKESAAVWRWGYRGNAVKRSMWVGVNVRARAGMCLQAMMLFPSL
jgi:hypothetical protein